MIKLDYSAVGIPVRADLQSAHRAIWSQLRSPGTWWTGVQRVAIAAETRLAACCDLCRRRKAALSPGGVPGQHDTLGALPASAVDVIHRVRTDPARLSRSWFDQAVASDLSEAEYVELIGVVTMVVGVDFCARALGLPPSHSLFRFPGSRRGGCLTRRNRARRDGFPPGGELFQALAQH